MLSKSEVYYLEGNKRLTSSYDGKIRCVIRKKLAKLKSEFILLNKIFGKEIGLLTEELIDLQNKGHDLQINPKVKLNSHINSSIIQATVGAGESLEGLNTSTATIEKATKFSNNIEKRRRERDLNLWVIDEGSS